jgi:hypothetical protein
MGSRSVVEDGVQRLESMVAGAVNLPSGPACELAYNLANGYAARQRLRWSDIWARGPVDISTDEDTRRQKILYQRVAMATSAARGEVHARALVNFGNLLDHLGRPVESVDQHYAALRIAPGHPAALSRSTAVLLSLTRLTHPFVPEHVGELERRARAVLRRRSGLMDVAGVDGVRVAEQDLSRIRELLAVPVRYGNLVHPASARVAYRRTGPLRRSEREILRRWTLEGLYLTVHALAARRPEYRADDAFPQRVVPSRPTDQSNAEGVFHGLNELKASYAAARFMMSAFAASPNPSVPFEHVGRFAVIGSAGPDWSLATSVRKAAYCVAADVLDKAAVLLNLFFAWGVSERKVSLKTVWYKDRRAERGVAPAVMEIFHRNRYVRGLFDLSLDWQDAEGLDRLQELRHALTHRYVPVFMDPAALGGHAKASSLTERDFAHLEMLMLRTARAVVLHTIAAVDLESTVRWNTRPPGRRGVFLVPAASADVPTTGAHRSGDARGEARNVNRAQRGRLGGRNQRTAVQLPRVARRADPRAG